MTTFTLTSQSADQAHLATLTARTRRGHGVVYTPEPVVRLVLDEEFGPSQGALGTTLDPACGTGVFLRELVRRVAREVGLLDDAGATDKSVSAAAADSFLTRIRRDIWGMDVDEAALAVADLELCLLVASLTGLPVPAGTFRPNLLHRDFLAPESWKALPEAPRHVVGNPPYVAIDQITPRDRERYRSEFVAAFGRIDLYTLFMEQACRAVQPGGSWTFVTPDKFATSTSGGPIRRFLTEQGHVRRLLYFDSHRVFAGAATVPCVTSWRSDPPTPAFQVARVTVADGDGAVSLDRRRELPTSALVSEPWSFLRRTDDSLSSRLARGGTPLGQVANRISAGPATGLNKAFVLDPEDAPDIEAVLLHPVLRGRDIDAFRVRPGAQRILLPYRWSDAGPTLVDLDDYPGARAWLEQHRVLLEQRHCVRTWGKRWWDLHDPVVSLRPGLPIVVVPDLAHHNRFAVDTSGSIPLHSAYFLVSDRVAPEALTAILNTPAAEYLMRTTAPVAKDGFLRYRRQFLSPLPIPVPDPETERELIELVTAGRHEEALARASSLFDVDETEILEALSAARPHDRGTRGTTRA